MMVPAPAAPAAPSVDDAARALREVYGLQLSAHLRSQLPEMIARAAAALKLTTGALLQRLGAADPVALEALVEECVVPETYFWRHPDQLTEAARAIRAEFPGEPIRAWSAGCATGEEPFSLAMAFQEAGTAASDLAIVGTDVSARSVERAREAIYGAWSFRAIPDGLRTRYFDKCGPDTLRPREALRRQLHFTRHNLHRDPPPAPSFHLIFCRNVFIYFAPEAASAALRRLQDALVPGGLLVIGFAEFPLATTLPMAWVDLKGVTALKKPKVAPRPAASKPTLTVARARASKPSLTDPLTPGRALRPSVEASPVPAPRQTITGGSAAVASVPAPAEPLLAAARLAAQSGDGAHAEKLALKAGRDHLVPEAWLLVAALREQRGDTAGALEATRRALYLAPTHPMAHAMQIPLYLCAGRPEDSERARRNALRALEGRDDGDLVEGVEPSTVAALRRALSPPSPTVRHPQTLRP